MKDLPGDTACVYVQQPNFFGLFEQAEEAAEPCPSGRRQGGDVRVSIALGISKSPGEMGYDIAVGEGQPLGISMSLGRPLPGLYDSQEGHNAHAAWPHCRGNGGQ